MASIDARLRLLAPGKVSEDDKLVDFDALLLDRFFKPCMERIWRKRIRLLTWSSLHIQLNLWADPYYRSMEGKSRFVLPHMLKVLCKRHHNDDKNELDEDPQREIQAACRTD